MELTVPGDKSLTHRALLLAALAEGESRLTGLLASEDPKATASCLRALGVEVPPLPQDGSEVRVRGVGLRGLISPSAQLDAANSGTTARLLLGVLSGQNAEATLTGDASLRRRPMERVTRPLAKMGARFVELGEPGRLPLRVHGGPLQPTRHRSPVASAQVKSAMLLAGLSGGVPVTVAEPRRSRDHTERLLRSLGVEIRGEAGAGGEWVVHLPAGVERIPPLDLHVPGDFSSAAFPMALGLLGAFGPEVRIRRVGLNPSRTGLLRVLARMGAQVEVEEGGVGGAESGEPTGTLVVRPGRLRATEVGGAEVPDLIDEVPVLCALAARAEGRTRITGAAELRVKESDRLHALALGLRAVGVEAEELDDGLEVQGTDQPLRGRVDSFGDHRIAMAFGVLGRGPRAEIQVHGAEAVDVSFPEFWSLIEGARSGSGAGGG